VPTTSFTTRYIDSESNGRRSSLTYLFLARISLLISGPRPLELPPQRRPPSRFRTLQPQPRKLDLSLKPIDLSRSTASFDTRQYSAFIAIFLALSALDPLQLAGRQALEHTPSATQSQPLPPMNQTETLPEHVEGFWVRKDDVTGAKEITGVDRGSLGPLIWMAVSPPSC
jgi:hypothetical protein